MPDCPTCGTSFDSQRGLGVHHSGAHGELLPNRECARCGVEFHSEHEKKYCSDDCRDEAVSFEGEKNPNYCGGKTATTCEICGSNFEYYPSAKPGRYCESCVESEEWRHERDISGERNPRWSGGEHELTCDWCDGKVVRQQTNISGEHVFCSPDCQYEWLSEEFTGDGHPNWKGGADANYGRGWNRVRRRALERDDDRCVLCGVTADELGRNPDVHHIVPVRAFVETPVTTEFDAHYLENVVSLCPSCHRKAEFGGVSPERLKTATGLVPNAEGL
ncbi:HNH endonuclease [Natronomonas gomsonensis]|uniref:HNH endonuclease n=1 Tax=Natronomonas gomsonensis TaxID=1046043 RepID=UPI0015B9D142|nr:HNH endonuclease signature motif containing protein [Natronomonas gomsonensis]